MDDQAEIDRHNRHLLWQSAAEHLAAACHAVERAQGTLDDLGEGPNAEQLQPLADDLRRAATEANEAAEREETA